QDNAARGINLGLRLLRQGVQAKIGVTTGTAFAGIVGNASRQEYAAVGDVVNMSARLMGKADRNTVLCDASTAGDAGDVFSFKEAMRIKVKGKEEPIAVFEPLSAGVVHQAKAGTAFLDRGDHAEGLQELLANAHAPAGTKTVLIEGERGSGKSILLSKAVGMMEGKNVQTFCSSGDMHERHTSLFPFREILCQLLELDQNLINWYGPGNRNKPQSPPPAATPTAPVAIPTPTPATVAVEHPKSKFRQQPSAKRRSSIVAVGLGLLGGGGGGGGGEGGELRAALDGSGGGGGAENGSPDATSSAAAAAAAAAASRKRGSWGANLPGRRRSVDTTGMANPYEPTVARGHLVNNPGFVSLMKDQELCKNLPLLNMILPLYNEKSHTFARTCSGFTLCHIQDTHDKLRRIADTIAALLAHRLEATKKDPPAEGETKEAPTAAPPAPANRKRRSSTITFRIPMLSDQKAPPPDTKGCKAAIVLDNAQWLDHNRCSWY
ncbi:unnamed protein product, partial [Laminaria digitata]